MPTTVVVNPPNQRISFKLPTTYDDGTTPLPASAIQDMAILVGPTSGGPYTKTIKDKDLIADADGFCNYPLASLGVDLTKATYAVIETEITGPGGTVIDSAVSEEIGFQNLAPNPPSAVSVG